MYSQCGGSYACCCAGHGLAFTSHDLTVTVLCGINPQADTVSAFQAAVTVQHVRMDASSPMRALAFLSNDCIVAGGFDGLPVQLLQRTDAWTVQSLMQGKP